MTGKEFDAYRRKEELLAAKELVLIFARGEYLKNIEVEDER